MPFYWIHVVTFGVAIVLSIGMFAAFGALVLAGYRWLSAKAKREELEAELLRRKMAEDGE